MPKALQPTTTIPAGAGTASPGDAGDLASDASEAASVALSAPSVSSTRPSSAKTGRFTASDVIETLSFVKNKPKKGTGRIWWAVPETEEKYADALGEGLAHEFLRFTLRWERQDGGLILCHIIEDMVRAGRWTSIEQAFVRVVAETIKGERAL